MTVKEKLMQSVVKKGLSLLEATHVVELAIPKIDELVPNYDITWNRPSEEYPNMLYVIMSPIVNGVALEWIEENCPQAWFKPMFT